MVYLSVFIITVIVLPALYIFHIKKIKTLSNLVNDRSKERERLSLVLSTSQTGFWEWDVMTNEIFYSKEWFAILGLDRESITGDFTAFSLYTNEEDLESAQEMIQSTLAGETKSFEHIFRMKHTSGEWIPVLSRATVVDTNEKGEALRIVGTHFDLSEIKKNEKIKKKQDDLIRSIERGEQIGAWEYDIKLNELDMSEFTKSLFCFDHPGELSQIEVLSFFDRASRKKILKSISNCLENGREEIINTKTNSNNFFKISFRRFFDKDIKHKKLRGTIHNITERVELEHQLENQKIHMINNSKMAVLGEMSASIAHELINPLAIISGLAMRINITLDKNEIIDKEKIKKISVKITGGVMRASKIIDGLKKYSGSKNTSFLEDVDFQNTLNNTLDLCFSRFVSTGIKLKQDNIENAIIKGHGGQLSQVLLSLLNNSYDSITEKNDPDMWIEVRAEIEKKKYIIKVIDSGNGIPKNIAQNLFKAFYSTKIDDKHTGLGMCISKKIIERFNGTLSYKEFNGHTCFEIILPYKQMEKHFLVS
jgi:PAS domain S-box-containing protein